MAENRFGSDLVLKDGDLVVGNGGDLFTTNDYEAQNADTNKFPGYYSMIFALTDRLMTAKGDHVFDFDYGSNVVKVLSTPNSTALRRNIQTAVRETVAEDPRVESVSYVNVDQQDRIISVKVGVTLKGNNEVFELVFPNWVIE